MITTIDVETSYQKTEAGGFDPSPFNPNNILVSVGINDEYYFTNHSERIDEGCFHKIQKILDETKILVGHNIKFDLSWLLEAGFTYTGNVYDTMIAEYVLNRGVRKSLTLLMCCQRRKLDAKDDAVKEYMDRGVSFENIPAEIVEQYGKIDVAITRQLFDSQMADLRTDKHKGLLKTIKVFYLLYQICIFHFLNYIIKIRIIYRSINRSVSSTNLGFYTSSTTIIGVSEI